MRNCEFLWTDAHAVNYYLCPSTEEKKVVEEETNPFNRYLELNKE